MKAVLSVAAVLAVAGAASANPLFPKDVLGLINTGPSAQVIGTGDTINVTGIRYMSTQSAAVGGWNSDTAIRLTAPNGNTFAFGGDTGSGTPAAMQQAPWSSGAGIPATSSGTTALVDVTYTGLNLGPANGNWTVEFFMTFGTTATADFTNTSIQLLVPTPASAALLGLGGLAAIRRRR